MLFLFVVILYLQFGCRQLQGGFVYYFGDVLLLFLLKFCEIWCDVFGLYGVVQCVGGEQFVGVYLQCIDGVLYVVMVFFVVIVQVDYQVGIVVYVIGDFFEVFLCDFGDVCIVVFIEFFKQEVMLYVEEELVCQCIGIVVIGQLYQQQVVELMGIVQEGQLVFVVFCIFQFSGVGQLQVCLVDQVQ